MATQNSWLGSEHRVPVTTALKAMTIWPAWQHFEENAKGSIEVGKLADFVILSDNPLTVPEDKLSDINVLETIKEGSSIYQRPADVASVPSPARFGTTQHVQHHEFGTHSQHAHSDGDGCFNPALDVLINAINKKVYKTQ